MDNVGNSKENWTSIKEKLMSRRDPVRAVAMAGYMRNQFEFLGIGASERQALTREFIHQTVRELNSAQIHLMARTLWQRKEREFQYLACDMLTRARRKWTPETFDLVKDLICDKSWWDTVDTLAAHLIGPLALAFPELQKRIDDFSTSDNLWLRRAAIISQLQSRNLADFERLKTYCLANAHVEDFFIRKAIGWALRTHARQDSQAVAQFLTDNSQKFSNLSLQEALKHHRPLYAQLARFGTRSIKGNNDPGEALATLVAANEPSEKPTPRPTLRPKSPAKPKRRPSKGTLRRPAR